MTRWVPAMAVAIWSCAPDRHVATEPPLSEPHGAAPAVAPAPRPNQQVPVVPPPPAPPRDVPADAAAVTVIDSAGSVAGSAAADSAARVESDARPASDSVQSSASDAFFGASRCQKANVLLCEDFEGSAIDPALWSLSQTRATLTVDSTRAARGKNSLHVTVTDPTADVWHLGAITSKKIFPVAGSRLFVRAFVYLDPASTHRHMNVFSAIGNFKYHVNVIPAWNPPYLPAKFRLLWDNGGVEPKEAYGTPTTQTPLGRWACWEWEIQGASNAMRFSLDDREIAPLKVDAPMGWTAPTTAHLRFGMEQFHAVNNGFSLWIDEIAVNTERIGCAL